MTANTPEDWLRANTTAATAELFEFLRIPSISARSEHRGDVARAAAWLADRLTSAGLAAASRSPSTRNRAACLMGRMLRDHAADRNA